MKIHFLIAFAATASLLPLHAEEQKPSSAMELIDIMNFTETAKGSAAGSFAPILGQMKAQGLPPKAIEEVIAAAEEFFSKTFEDPDFRTEIAEVYEKNYSESELVELIAFYETPLGKKTLAAMPQVMQQSNLIGQKFALKNQAEFQAELQGIMMKHAPAPAAEPKAAPTPAIEE